LGGPSLDSCRDLRLGDYRKGGEWGWGKVRREGTSYLEARRVDSYPIQRAGSEARGRETLNRKKLNSGDEAREGSVGWLGG